MSNLYLNFHKFNILIKCESEKVTKLLEKDFHYFISNSTSPNLTINATVTSQIDHLIPEGLISCGQNSRAIFFENKNFRYNYFYSKAVSIINKNSGHIDTYSLNEDYLHELLYLLILSKHTKHNDMRGVHKIHAFGIQKGEVNLIGMMESKGGKTTLFSSFLNDEAYKIISDDTPLINRKGEVMPFPIRLGFEVGSFSEKILSNNLKASYPFKREEFSEKKLIDILEFSNSIAGRSKKNILFQGRRIFSNNKPGFKKISKFKMLGHLKRHFIIGMGLPMILEYYLNSDFSDKLNLLKILLSRLISALNLLRNSICYEFYLCSDPQKNIEKAKELLDIHQ